MSRKNDGISETILGWFKRMHPEELWAVKKMPPRQEEHETPRQPLLVETRYVGRPA